jgi:hypothetical protein
LQRSGDGVTAWAFEAYTLLSDIPYVPASAPGPFYRLTAEQPNGTAISQPSNVIHIT